MPLYEYRCEECGLRFEIRQKFSDAPIETCRKCGGRVSKLISQTAFALKGGGWYQEGYVSSKNGDSGSGKTESKTVKPTAKSGSDSCASCPKVANG